MKKALVVSALVVALGVAAWTVLSLGLIRPPAAGPTPPAAAPTIPTGPPCTPEAPCRIRILFGATRRGLEAIRASNIDLRRGCAHGVGCLLPDVAKADTEELARAFEVSGVSQTSQGKRSIELTYDVLPMPIDDEEAAPIEDAHPEFPASKMTYSIKDRLPSVKRLHDAAKAQPAYNAVVVFGRTSIVGCYMNSLSGSGYVVLPACTTDGFWADKDARLKHVLLFLHELGHVFGASHNDAAHLQPCTTAQACAWEQCTDKRCTPEELAYAPHAFCTLVGQWDVLDPDGRASGCLAHTDGEQGTGWIREYSHPGSCRSPGFERFQCGDARHDAASVMRAGASRVARARPPVS